MNDATRQLVEMSLRVRSIRDTYLLFSHAISGEEITVRQIAGIRKRMVERNELTAPPLSRSHIFDAEPIAGNDAAVHMATARSSDALRGAIFDMFERKASRLGCSVEAAMKFTLYSPRQIARMNGAAA